MNIDLGQTQRLIEWLKEKLYLNTLVESSRKRLVKRGQVYRCNFGYGVGSEMRKDRPAIIVQNAVGNIHSSNTIVIPVTHNTNSLPCMVNLTPEKTPEGFVILDGQANASNIMCVSKARLGDYICTLTKEDMRKIDQAIATTMGIMTYYSSICARLDDKLQYIDKLTTKCNDLQTELNSVRHYLGLSSDDSIIEKLDKMYIDKEQ